MIIYPSLDELMKKVDSPYSLVILAARRARQLNLGGAGLLEKYRSKKAVSRSLEEIDQEKIKYRAKYKKDIK
ncbi:MAG: DNA-directed RNA polymerase subunit omega [Firmicutes bacterium]|nr:DNA-directed RNA polymerase subunit omega [Bacillota bacterium]